MAFTLQAVLKFKDESKRGLDTAEKGFGKLGDAVKTAGIALGAAFAADKVLDLAKMGATAERVEQRFGMLAKEAGGAEAVLAAFQRGAGGAASSMDAMASSSKLLQMGLVNSAGEMENVVTMATRLGDQTTGVSDRVADFALMLANQSIPRLDNFGISSGRVRAKIAELQAAMPGLTRETAFMQAVMEEGGDSLERLGPRVDDGLASFERMEAQMADLAVVVGQVLVPAFSALLNIVTPIIGGIAGLITELDEFDQKSEEVTNTIVSLADNVQGADDVAKVYADAMSEAADVTDGWNGAILSLGDAFLGTSSRGEILNQIQDEMVKTALENASGYEEFRSILEDYNKSLGKTGDTADEVMDAQAQANATMGEFGSIIGDAADTLPDVTEGIRVLTQAEYELATGTGAAAHELRKLEEGYRLANSAAAEYEQQIQFTEGELRGMTNATESFDQAMLNSVNAIKSGIVVTDEHEIALKQQYQAAQEAEAAAAAAAATAAERADRQAAAAERQAAALETSRQAAIASAEAQAKLSQSLMDATEKQIAQTLIEQLDPDALGATAYTGAVQEIQLAYGLADEKSIALSSSIMALGEAVNTGAVAFGSADEALAALIADAEDGSVNIESLLNQFQSTTTTTAELEARFAATGQNLSDLNANMTEFIPAGEALATNTEQIKNQMLNTGVAVTDNVTHLTTWTDTITGAEKVTGEYHSTLSGLNENLALAGEESIHWTDAIAGLNAVGEKTSEWTVPFNSESVTLHSTLVATGEAGGIVQTEITGIGDAALVAAKQVNELSSALSGIPSAGGGGSPGGDGFQMGGIITGGRIGEPRTIRAHVGEIVLNPFQPGALGGPGGPQPVTNNIGGDTFVNNVYDPMAAKVLATEQYRMRRRRSRL